jgi:hypothetical protein
MRRHFIAPEILGKAIRLTFESGGASVLANLVSFTRNFFNPWHAEAQRRRLDTRLSFP